MNLKLTLTGGALVLLALATLVAAPPPGVRAQSARPSFDCSKARSRIDKLVCANAELAALDRRVAELFELAMSQAPDAGDIKRAQRRWLRDRNDCQDAACMRSQYEQRIRALETYTGRLPAALVQTMCERLETPETRAEILAHKDGIEDINNDGVPETPVTCNGGTANIPCAAYADAGGKPLQIRPQGFEWHTYSPLGRTTFRYDDRTFVYYSRDAALEEPSYVSYVTPTNRELPICEFETSVGSAVVEGGADVCAAVESGENIEEIELASIADRDATAFARADTFARRIGAVDIDNDGLNDNVLELSYESGGGRGCTFNYFELLTDDRRSLLTTSKRNPVRELQGVPAEGYRGRNCGRIDNRLFRFEDKIYYEANVSNNALAPHEVRVLDGTAVATLCTFERQTMTRVKRLFAE